MTKIGVILRAFEEWAPTSTAESWDNVGLLAGDEEWETSGALVTIDLTREAIQQCKKLGYRLIIAHHPALFPKNRGLSRLTGSHPLLEAYSEKIAVFCCHTNFDRCVLEALLPVAEGLGVQPQGRLLDLSPDSSMPLKLVTYVPETHADSVRQALNEAGAGWIGRYDSCSFQVLGQGTFRGLEGTQPHLGNPGVLEKTPEIRLETVVPQSLRERVTQALLQAHPYEEVAFEFFQIHSPTKMGAPWASGHGYGFWGVFPKPQPFSEIARSVKTLFQIEGYGLTQPVPSAIQKIAFVAGKGAAMMESALRMKVDLLILGEAGYHAALDCRKKGMAVLELGHRQSEAFFSKTVVQWLSRKGISAQLWDEPIQKILH